MCVTNHSEKTFLEKQSIVYIYMLQYSDWRTTALSFSVCTFLSPPNTFFSCKTFVVICTYCGTLFFTKAPSFQGSSIALKKNIVYTGCSPSIGCASGIPPFFLGKERKHRKEQTKQKMKDKEKKGEERTRSKTKGKERT